MVLQVGPLWKQMRGPESLCRGLLGRCLCEMQDKRKQTGKDKGQGSAEDLHGLHKFRSPLGEKLLEVWEGSTLGPQPTPDLCSNLKLFLQVSGQNPLSANNARSHNHDYQHRWGIWV